MDFFSFTVGELSVAQFSYLIFLYFLFAGFTIAFMDHVVSFICKLIRGIFNRDKNGQ